MKTVMQLIADKTERSVSELSMPKYDNVLFASCKEIVEIAQEYARIQIEKDRERVKANLIGVRPTLVFQSIDETPIEQILLIHEKMIDMLDITCDTLDEFIYEYQLIFDPVSVNLRDLLTPQRTGEKEG